MKKISLTKNKFLLIDDNDYKKISKYNWWLTGKINHYYAMAKIKNKNILLHRLLLKPKKKLLVDHIDGNGLNNARKNIRIATKSQNNANRKIQINNKSKYKGVSYYKKTKKWRTVIKYNNKHHHLGYFENKECAALAYNKRAIEMFGKFAKINIVDNS